MMKWYQKNSPVQTVKELDEAADAGETTENIYVPGNTTPPAVVLREGYSSSNTTYPRTYATYDAQMKLNDDIYNNKDGYLGVETMSIQDFYNAGGNFFVEDYNQQLQDLDAAYDRALPGYGVRGEQMAQAGLTGSGYGDYLSGQAYAVRAQGQAASRQQYQQNRQTFLASYNQYRQDMAEKRQQNLLQTVQSAYAAGQSEEMYAHYAKAVGIPEEDIERGMMALRALYNGYEPGQSLTQEEQDQIDNSPYGVTDEQMATVDGLYQQIIGGIDGMTDEDGKTVVSQYPTLDAALAALKGSYKDPNGKILEAAKKKVLDTVLANVEGTLSQPDGYISKSELDRYAEYGIFGDDGKESEEYKRLLEQAQGKAYTAATNAYSSNDIGTMRNLNADNAIQYEASLMDVLFQNGYINEKQYNQFFYDNLLTDANSKNLQEFGKYVNGVFQYKDKLGDMKDAAYSAAWEGTLYEGSFSKDNGTVNLEFKLPNGYTYDFYAYYKNPISGKKVQASKSLEDRLNKVKSDTGIVYNKDDDSFYVLSRDHWYKVPGGTWTFSENTRMFESKKKIAKMSSEVMEDFFKSVFSLEKLESEGIASGAYISGASKGVGQ